MMRCGTVIRIFDFALTGSYSVRRLTEEVRNWGLKTRRRKRSGDKYLSIASVHSLLRNPFYAGVLDRTVGAPGVTNSTAATACTFPPVPRTQLSDAVIVGFRSHVTTSVAGAEQAAVVKLHATTTDVSGDGNTAYYYTARAAGGDTVTTLVTLVGETQVTVSSTASAAQAETLTQQIFASLATAATSTTTTVAS